MAFSILHLPRQNEIACAFRGPAATNKASHLQNALSGIELNLYRVLLMDGGGTALGRFHETTHAFRNNSRSSGFGDSNPEWAEGMLWDAGIVVRRSFASSGREDRNFDALCAQIKGLNKRHQGGIAPLKISTQFLADIGILVGDLGPPKDALEHI